MERKKIQNTSSCRGVGVSFVSHKTVKAKKNIFPESFAHSSENSSFIILKQLDYSPQNGSITNQRRPCSL